MSETCLEPEDIELWTYFNVTRDDTGQADTVVGFFAVKRRRVSSHLTVDVHYQHALRRNKTRALHVFAGGWTRSGYDPQVASALQIAGQDREERSGALVWSRLAATATSVGITVH